MVRLSSSPFAFILKDFVIPNFVAPLTLDAFYRKRLISLLFSVALTAPTAAAAVQLEADTKVATAGYFQLRWRADSPVELQESMSPQFDSPRSVYSGSDAARVMSGKPDGDWYYRIGEANGNFSDTVKISVRHHPIERAIGFFAVGAVVFTATLLLIVSGARRRDESSDRRHIQPR